MNILIRNVKYSLAFVILLNGLTILMARAEDDFSSLDTRHYSSSVYGGVGLLQIPTARFSGDGDFLFGISTESPWHRLYSKVQFLPWMEAVLRYTDATYKPYNPGSGQTWKDKAFDVRFRLSEEGQYMPAIAFGLTDLGGTGAYASEFFVASKFINNIDYTLGIGWGRFGGKDHFSNPLKFINDGKGSNDELGGTLSFAQFFKDSKPAMFAGIEYFTPIENLSLKLEYDTSDYSDVDGLPRHMNKEGDIFKVQSAFNIGLTYRKVFSKRNYADLSFGLMRGNTFYANVTAATDLNLKNRLKIKIPKEILNTPYLEEFSTLTPEWQKYLADLIAWQMSNEGMVAHNVIFNDNELIAEVTQGRFLNPVHGIDLAARILGNNSPKNISQITVVNIDQGIETFRATIARDDLVKSVARGPIAEEIIDYNSYEDLSSEAYIMPNDALYPHFSWSIRPIIAGTLQHQIAFYLWDVQALVKAEYAIRKGIYLNLDYGIGIGGNFDDYLWHVPDGSLHHVRQDRRLYLTEGRNGIRRLALDYLFEVNEAFAAVPLYFMQALNIDASRVNMNGGAIALGHPLGATGAKLMTTMLHELERREGKYALQAICEGGGTANATIIERI